jgi:hypothetical protein
MSFRNVAFSWGKGGVPSTTSHAYTYAYSSALAKLFHGAQSASLASLPNSTFSRRAVA